MCISPVKTIDIGITRSCVLGGNLIPRQQKFGSYDSGETVSEKIRVFYFFNYLQYAFFSMLFTYRFGSKYDV